MKLVLSDTFKSLHPFESDELNDLTIITGKNGAGKSQLLDLIAKKKQDHDSVKTIRVEFIPPINKIQVEGIEKSQSSELSYTHWKQRIDRKTQVFAQMGKAAVELVSFIIENSIDIGEALSENTQSLLSEKSEYKELLDKVNTEFRGPKLLSQPVRLQRRVLRQIFLGETNSIVKSLKHISEINKKSVRDIIVQDFYTTELPEDVIDDEELFSSQIEIIFYNYAKRRDSNGRKYFQKKQYGAINESISDEEFIHKFRPPWLIINEILQKHSIDFNLSEIDPGTFDPQISFPLQLVKKSINKAIDFGELSSGEKVIVGLILKLFAGEYYAGKLQFPELLILDEPDAHLHPEMSKLLLDVLGNTFVDKFGIKTILTTHSPSTIALASESSIYELRNHYQSALTKITKDKALEMLTSFIPTLSIDYKSHRQVFVESPTDIDYFQRLYNKHSQKKNLPHKLYFIANSMGNGNSTLVYKIVSEIRKSGNQTSFGIVDWDTTNKPSEFVVVHGENERYSIENFLLEPVYVITLLIQLNNAHGIAGKIGVDLADNEYLIGNKTSDELQNIIDRYFMEIYNRFPAYKAHIDTIEIAYLNERKVKLPTWYLLHQGHSLVDLLKETFPALKKYEDEGSLQGELAEIMIKSYPFVSASSISLIEQLSEKGIF